MIENFNLSELASLGGIAFGAYRAYSLQDYAALAALAGAGLIKLNSAGQSKATFGDDTGDRALKLTNVNGLEAAVLAAIVFGAYRLIVKKEYLAAALCVVPLFIGGREAAASEHTF